jgi:hypothetical protein
MTTEEFGSLLDPDIYEQLRSIAMAVNVPLETLLEEALNNYQKVIKREWKLDLSEDEHVEIELIAQRTSLTREQIASWILLEYLERTKESLKEAGEI